MLNNYINKTKKKVDFTNTCQKLTTPLKNRIPMNFIRKVDDHFKCQKEVLIFDVLKSIRSSTGNDCTQLNNKKNISYNNIIWTAWFQGADNLPPLIRKCIDSFTKIKNRDVIIIDKNNYSDYIQLPATIVNKFNSGIISFTAFSEIIRISLLAEYGGLWLDATIFVDRDISFLLDDKKYVSLRSHKNLSHGNLMGAFPVYFLYTNGHSDGFNAIRDYLLNYWHHFDVQVDYFLVDYIFKYVYLNNESFKEDTDSLPLLGKKRFFLNDIMNKAYNEADAKELKFNDVPVYKLSNKLVYKEVDASGKDTFFKKFINGNPLY